MSNLCLPFGSTYRHLFWIFTHFPHSWAMAVAAIGYAYGSIAYATPRSAAAAYVDDAGTTKLIDPNDSKVCQMWRRRQNSFAMCICADHFSELNINQAHVVGWNENPEIYSVPHIFTCAQRSIQCKRATIFFSNTNTHICWLHGLFTLLSAHCERLDNKVPKPEILLTFSTSYWCCWSSTETGAFLRQMALGQSAVVQDEIRRIWVTITIELDRFSCQIRSRRNLMRVVTSENLIPN